jgi:glycosyltransferase involved in cell wall biosynthesis
VTRVAIISDTLDDTNGVALGLRRLVAAAVRAGHRVHLVGAARADAVAGDTVVRIPAALSASLPIYPGMTWSVPELPALVDHLARCADLVQVSTPGPMGIAGLIAGRMLGLPVIAQYHTEVAEFAARMTGMPMLGAIVQPIVGWFYQQAELCLAPSAAVVDRLASLGVPRDRIVRVRRGVDLALFDPARRDRSLLGDTPTALYVGRLSREKNLDGLLAAWALVRRAHPGAQLAIVGEGPLAGTLARAGVIELGPAHGTELAALFASADVFAFASETETFGNVVVEAAASGVPAVVGIKGAAHEHVIHGETGLVAHGTEAFAAAIVRLFDDPVARARMGAAARLHAQSYDLAHAVRATMDIYRGIARTREAA